jgi:hypothetical protein
MLDVLADCFIDVGGGLAAAIVATALAWTLFKIVDHPEWGCPVLVLTIVAAARGMPQNHFLQMMTFFLAIASLIIWHEGAEWRRRQRESPFDVRSQRLVERRAGRAHRDAD